MNAGSASLDVVGLTAAYGRMVVVHGVSLTVSPGTIHAVLGPNGAGKTSLLEAISGRVNGGGRVELQGRKLDSLPAYRRARAGLALVPTTRGLFPGLSVEENLNLGLRLAPASKRLVLRDRVLATFPKVRDRLHQPAGQMSGGEQQMLAIARALSADPVVLLLDEPTQGLAPHLVEELGKAIRDLSRDGLAVLLAEQNQPFALAVADTFSVLVQGSVVRHGDPQSLGSRDDLFAAYMGNEEE